MTCLECRAPIIQPSRGGEKRFCCHAHRKAFNNRRSMRGAQMYDLFMAMRYDRQAASDAGVWGYICRMAEQWHDEDVAAGRASFGDWREFMVSNPALNPSVTVRLPSMKIRRKK